MALLPLGLTPIRRGVGGTLVLFLLVCAVLYHRAPSGSPPAARGPSTWTSGSSSTPTADPLPPAATPEASSPSGSPSTDTPTIEIDPDRATSAEPFETVRLRGTYHGGPTAFVRVEVREGATWVPFPLRPKTDRLGRFTTHVELARPGPHWLRVADPLARVASEPFVMMIEG